jgi:NADH-quinone oxidoreductase subunit G
MELEIDGKKIQAESGLTILEVALREDKYIPHFCYHKKLSIAANCRMCLVEVEKANKPLPACATPITDGMKIWTQSELARNAQQGVMELLLINHPLDCPICDQGGECHLQDLALGYGKSQSRFTEPKRSVTNKDLGHLVSTEMTRCIHCSRCVRFTDEIAGLQELGMSYRNNHVEVMPFIGSTVDSELSGNIIDICPVGALTSKPFRNQYRSWELSRRKSISPHDGLGSNIVAQVDKYHQVVRVLPLENEQINECWLSDRDRFSYEGLYHQQRLTSPMIKINNQWSAVSWQVALENVVSKLTDIIQTNGTNQVGVLANAISTNEELYLLQKLMRGLGIYNLDYRLNQNDFQLDGKQQGCNYFEGDLSALENSQSILVIGSNLRFEMPLVAQRIRKAVNRNATLNIINVIKENVLCAVNQQITCDPRQIVDYVAQLVKATTSKNVENNIDLTAINVTPQAQQIADSLVAQNSYIVLGEIAKSLNNYSQLLILVDQLKRNIQGKLAIVSLNANFVGANVVGFVPYYSEQRGFNVQQMLTNKLAAYVLFNSELEYDVIDSQLALTALNNAQLVTVMTPFVNDNMLQYADILLPITPYTETAGSYFNMQGKLQLFNNVTRPWQNAKPGWQLLSNLATMLLPQNIADFSYENITVVRNEISQLVVNLSNSLFGTNNFQLTPVLLNSLVRVGLRSIYATDSIVRRAQSLQQTPLAAVTKQVAISKQLATKLAISENSNISVKQNQISKQFNVKIQDNIPDTVVLLGMYDDTIGFAGLYDTIEVIV